MATLHLIMGVVNVSCLVALLLSGAFNSIGVAAIIVNSISATLNLGIWMTRKT